MSPQRRQGRRATAGALLIALLLGLAILVVMLDDIVRRLQDRYTLIGVFREAHHLGSGTPVWVGGYPVGRVRRVEILPLGRSGHAAYAATLELPRAVQPQVRADSEVRIRRDLAMGTTVVDIVPGTPAAPPLVEGDTLRARAPVARRAFLDEFAAFRRSLDTLAATGRQLHAQVEAVAPRLAPLAREIERARREFALLTRGYEEGSLAALRADTAWRASLRDARAAVGAIGAAIRARAAQFRDPALREAAGRIATRAERLGERIAELQALLDAPLGLPTRARQDPALREALQAVEAQLDSLVAETLRRPWRYFF